MEYNASLHLPPSSVQLDFPLHQIYFSNFFPLTHSGMGLEDTTVSITPLFDIVTKVVLCVPCMSNMNAQGLVYLRIVFEEKKETKYAAAGRWHVISSEKKKKEIREHQVVCMLLSAFVIPWE